MGEPPAVRTVRCSEAEREQAIDVLRAAMTDGRLGLDEFSQRVDGAHAARTTADLLSLIDDLPAASAPSAELRAPRHTTAFAHVVRSGGPALAARSRYRCLWGTLSLDLTDSPPVHPESVVEVFNLFGTVSITVPDHVNVEVDGRGLFASQLIERAPAPPPVHASTLRIRVRGPGGTCYVRYASGRERPRPTRYV